MSDEVYVVGRSRENAQRLLKIAADLDLPVSLVRTTDGGYLVPEEIAAAYDGKPAKAAQAPEAAEEAAIGDLSKAELVEMAEAHDLPTSGTKADLIERIEQARTTDSEKE
jgi:hypothetical protein